LGTHQGHVYSILEQHVRLKKMLPTNRNLYFGCGLSFVAFDISHGHPCIRWPRILQNLLLLGLRI